MSSHDSSAVRSNALQYVAGLCGASLHVWYKAVFQELLQQWSALASQVSQLHKAKWAPTHQEGVDKAMQQLRHCSKVYSALLALNKVHMKRVQVRRCSLASTPCADCMSCQACAWTP